jgi:hemoglobin/transferrin/lactoferrin receptor protein
MKNFIYSLAAALFSLQAGAQTLTVVDMTTREAIPGVSVYSGVPRALTVTNARGQADLSPFRGADSIRLSYVGYKERTYSYAQLEKRKFTAELAEDNISLHEVVVSANRWEEEQMEIPYRVEKISMKEMALQNPQTSADLLGAGGYVYIQKSQLAGGSPTIRGFATNRVLIVVDGVRMNNAIFRSGNLQNVISLDAGSFESAEVLFGPGAVLYGSDAIGGVMDFHTLKPQFSGGDSTLVRGSAFSRYASANREKTGHLDLRLGLKKWAFTTAATYSDYDDLRTGSHGNSYFLRPFYQERVNGKDTILRNTDPSLQVRSGYSQLNLMQKISYQPAKNWNLEYGFLYSTTSNAPRYDRLYLDANSDSIFDNAEWYYGPQKWMMNRLGMTHSGSGRLYDRMRVIAAVQRYEESRHDRRFGSSKRRNQMESVDAYSLSLDLDKKISSRTTWFYGIEGVLNFIGSKANRVNINTGEMDPPINSRYPDGSAWTSYGAYASIKHRLTDKLLANAGIRYSYFSTDVKFDTTLFPYPFTSTRNSNGALNGSLGLVYTPAPSWQLYVNSSTGFRAPNIDDIGKVFESEPGSLVVPNADLKPEYAWNAEIGTSRTFGSYLKTDVSAYYTFLDNALVRRNFRLNGQDSLFYEGEMSRVQAIQNAANAYVYGLQAGIEIYLGGGAGLRSTFNHTKGREQSGDSLVYYPLSHTTPAFGSTHLTYERRKLKLDLYAEYNSRMMYSDLALSERNNSYPYAKDGDGLPFTPGWYTLNFKMAFFASSHLSVNAGIENITDRLYRTYGSGISAPGRNYMAALKVKF